MLGDLVGGYTPIEVLAEGAWYVPFRQLAAIPALLLTPLGVGTLALLISACIALALIDLRLKDLYFFALVVVLIAVPLWPLAMASALGRERFFVALWAMLALGVAAGFRTVKRGAGGVFVTLSVLLLALSAGQRTLETLAGFADERQEYFAQGRLILDGDSADVILLTGRLLPHYAPGMLALRTELGREGPPPTVIADEVDLAGLPMVERRVWQYDSKRSIMQDITQNVQEKVRRWSEQLEPAPLRVSIQFDAVGRRVTWNFGPSRDGQFFFLTSQERVPIRAAGVLRMEKPPSESFRVLYVKTDGRRVYSPPLCVPPVNEHGMAELVWVGRGVTAVGPPEGECVPEVGRAAQAAGA
jgi:hypothetical protein